MIGVKGETPFRRSEVFTIILHTEEVKTPLTPADSVLRSADSLVVAGHIIAGDAGLKRD